MTELTLYAAGRHVPDASDRIRRYCGLPWSGGPPETWAWQYYDAIPSLHDNVVRPLDVVSAAALHPGLTRRDLAFFRERGDELSQWLGMIDSDKLLWQADDVALAHLASMVKFEPDVSVSLLSKVLHRKRPHMIPLLDRHIVDWFRPVTGRRENYEAWPRIMRALHADLADPERCLLTAIFASTVRGELEAFGGKGYPVGTSWLRLIDISIWMGSR